MIFQISCPIQDSRDSNMTETLHSYWMKCKRQFISMILSNYNITMLNQRNKGIRYSAAFYQKDTFKNSLLQSNPQTVWSATNQQTNKYQGNNSKLVDEISTDELNSHFTGSEDKIVQNDRSGLNYLQHVKEFCDSKGLGLITYKLHTLVSPTQVIKHLSTYSQTRTCNLEGVDDKIHWCNPQF